MFQRGDIVAYTETLDKVKVLRDKGDGRYFVKFLDNDEYKIVNEDELVGLEKDG